MVKKFKDESGNKYGMLTVLSFSHIRWRDYFWLCKCDCGNESTVNIGSLKRGHTKSCGCYNVSSRLIHGHCSKKTITSEFRCWDAMKQRCINPNHKSYKDYGARGITVCDRWMNSFENFLNDMGLRPSNKHSIDRIDNNDSYYPENCRWYTEQNKNTRANQWRTYDGRTQIVADWRREFNIPSTTFYRLVNKPSFDVVFAGLDLQNQLNKINNKYKII